MKHLEKVDWLTEEILKERFKITRVSEDGKHVYHKVRGKEKECHQILCRSGNNRRYYKARVYDECAYRRRKAAGATYNDGYIKIPVHRIVYAFHKGPIPPYYHVDHANNDSLDNHKDNLQLKTPGANQHKEKPNDCTGTGHCGKNATLPHIFEMCYKYLDEYEAAKIQADKALIRRAKSKLVCYMRKLRYLFKRDGLEVPYICVDTLHINRHL